VVKLGVIRVAIISDTHVGQRVENLSRELLEELARCDVIVHAGDYTNYKTVQELSGITKSFFGVAGNMDDEITQQKLPQTLTFEISGLTFGLMHGSGSPWGISKRIYEAFKEPRPRVIVFGHSHIPLEENRGSSLILNPGSTSGNLFSTLGSYIIMEIDTNGKFYYTKKEIKP